MTKISLIEYYFFQRYTTVSNTDLYLSYVFPGHNDSIERGLTVTVFSSFFTKYHTIRIGL